MIRRKRSLFGCLHSAPVILNTYQLHAIVDVLFQLKKVHIFLLVCKSTLIFFIAIFFRFSGVKGLHVSIICSRCEGFRCLHQVYNNMRIESYDTHVLEFTLTDFDY